MNITGLRFLNDILPARGSGRPRAGGERSRRLLGVGAFALIAVAIWLPRTLALDRFVTTDEPLWVTRAANFYCALGRRDFAQTYQREHPGVTTMWAGMAGLALHWRQYKSDCQYLSDKVAHESVFREHGIEPIVLLQSARFFIVLGGTIALVIAFAYAQRLLGFGPATLGFWLIAFDPFHAAYSRLLHLDGLLSSMMLLALLAFVSYLRRRRLCDLIVSGVATGLGSLTKSPGLFLVPVAGLLALAKLWQSARRDNGASLARLVWWSAWPVIAWAAVGAATFVALWPAMWVAPVATVSKVIRLAFVYASGGHASSVFYRGTLVADGQLGASFPFFYPVTYLWRSTPVTLAGLLAAFIMAVRRRAPLDRPEIRRTVAGLVLFTAVFAAVITFSTKKFERYLLPVYAPLDLVAAVGWAAVAYWLRESRLQLVRRCGAVVALGLAVVVQAVVSLQTFPYYLCYYNALMGGSRRAAKVMMIGWGEGLDQAARILNEEPDAQKLYVSSWYRNGCFSYFFAGASMNIANQPLWTEIDLQRVVNTDYAVIYYVHQQQRQVPSELLTLLKAMEPEHSVWISGLEYVRIYKLRHDLDVDPSYVQADVLLGEHILLEGYSFPQGEYAPGGVVPVWLFWRAVSAPGEELKVFVQVLNQAGVLVAQNDAEPVCWSHPTQDWRREERVTDGHGVQLPPDLPPGDYTLVAGMYRYSGERLPITREGQMLGDAFTLGQMTVRLQ